MTALGPNARNVAGLVYIAAFGLDEGESIGGLLAQGPADPGPRAPGQSTPLGFAWLPEDDFVKHFAADVDPARARVLHAVQQALSAQHAPGRDGRPGPGSHSRAGSSSPATTRPSRPRPSASSAKRMGRHHRRGAVRPPGDDLPPGRG